MSELSGGVMLTENALRCVARSIEMFYKKKAQNRDWCITTVRNAADQFEKMREEISTRRAQPAEPPVRCGECANYQTQNCAAKHEQALMDFCSHGIRKPGGEQNANV